MKLVVGLGNPGKAYLWTRHNAGALLLDYLVAREDTASGEPPKWQTKAAFSAEICQLEQSLLAKPTTFYNESGRAVETLCRFYKLDPSRDLLVVCDDFALPFGQLRLREQGSDGGNNGLKSIIAALGPNFARLRLGTDAPLRNRSGDSDFVLGRWSAEEKAALPEILTAASQILENWLRD